MTAFKGKVKWSFLDEIHHHGSFTVQYVLRPRRPPLCYDSTAFRVLEDLRSSSRTLLPLSPEQRNIPILWGFFSFAAIVTAYETNTHDPSNNNAMLGVHASASAIIQYGKIARKQVLGLTQSSF